MFYLYVENSFVDRYLDIDSLSEKLVEIGITGHCLIRLFYDLGRHGSSHEYVKINYSTYAEFFSVDVFLDDRTVE